MAKIKVKKFLSTRDKAEIALHTNSYPCFWHTQIKLYTPVFFFWQGFLQSNDKIKVKLKAMRAPCRHAAYVTGLPPIFWHFWTQLENTFSKLESCSFQLSHRTHKRGRRRDLFEEWVLLASCVWQNKTPHRGQKCRFHIYIEYMCFMKTSSSAFWKP